MNACISSASTSSNGGERGGSAVWVRRSVTNFAFGGGGRSCPVRSAILGAFSDVGGASADAGGPWPESGSIDPCLRTHSGRWRRRSFVAELWPPRTNWIYDACTCLSALRAAPCRPSEACDWPSSTSPGSKYRNTAAKVFELVEAVDRPNVGVYFDIANGLYIGDDPVESARIVAPRVVQYHVKGYKAERSSTRCRWGK
jgi:hypothetical protein